MTNVAPGWELYRSFLHVVRDGSLSAAARGLGLTQPTIGRHVEQLEAALGTPLFTRSPQGLLPTAAALDLSPHAEAMADAAAALLRAASGEAGAEHGTVRLSASQIMGAEVLPPILGRFRRDHPGVVIELSLSNRTEDLLRRRADVAIRHFRPTQTGLVARRLATVAVHLYAHRAYAEAHGLPETPPDLARHTLIGDDLDGQTLRASGGLGLTRESFAIRCDNDLGKLAMIRAGLGIGGCQAPVAARDPALLPVLADRLRWPLEIWVVMHEDLRASRRVRLLFDHLAASLAA
ncbi:LysR family transcriptional regulator [Plastoroseomonas arctica]|uniref:LysR family transcriptional regulator n=1 Tax=Plastoroseomonas arctica TaxID=1509237 RepID=A0AAF1KNS8_9PROT|nr:LysR family transcriptional regulator [Plastoroseomonas arctica]MBR0656594.1 LysR family transcriptional regulator [Plastoroseomonas arctica]